MPDWIECRAGPDDAGRRIDRVVRIAFPSLPLSALHRAFRQGRVRVAGTRVEPAYRLAAGDVIRLRLAGETQAAAAGAPTLHEAPVVAGPPAMVGAASPPGELPSAPGKREADMGILSPWLVAASPDLLVLSKPRGMLVHDGDESLEAKVRAALASESRGSLSFRPGPLHRLDRNTSGIVVFSRSAGGARRFSAAVRARLVRKAYLAILEGKLAAPGDWIDELERDRDCRVTLASGDGGGLGIAIGRAESRVHPVASDGETTLAMVEILTGRTHQIRAQAAIHGFRLLGDRKYGSTARCGHFLHAYCLVLPAGLDAALPQALFAPPPGDFLSETSRRYGIGESGLPGFADIPFARKGAENV